MFKQIPATLGIAVLLPLAAPALGDSAATPLRTASDSHRSYQWELAWDSVALYEGSRSTLIRRLPLAGATQSGARNSCPPELAIGPTGSAYVTSNILPVLWRIDPASMRVERLDFSVEDDPLRDFGFTGLGWSADGSTLYATSTVDGAAWHLDPATLRATRIGQPGAANRDCG